jgi:Leucine Rich Repeat
MVHLNLQGCRRVDSGVVHALSLAWTQLETLQLGGCSQTIGDACVRIVCVRLRQLRVLGLSGLKRIGTTGGCLVALPSSLECLDLSGCEQVCFNALGRISRSLYAFAQGNIQALANKSIHEMWTLLESGMDAVSRDLVEESRSVSFSNLLATGWNLQILNLSHCGIAHSTGLPAGVLGFLACFSGGLLREVDISGCSNVSDADIKP